MCSDKEEKNGIEEMCSDKEEKNGIEEMCSDKEEKKERKGRFVAPKKFIFKLFT